MNSVKDHLPNKSQYAALERNIAYPLVEEVALISCVKYLVVKLLECEPHFYLSEI